MANRFTQNFTLRDIFSNDKLKKKLPYIDYKEQEKDGKVSQRASINSVRDQIFDTAVSTARPYYSSMTATRTENRLDIGGEMTGDHNSAVNEVYNAINSIKSVLIWTANNGEMIKSALKESERNRRNFGIDTKLYLRAQSMLEIEGMSRAQLQALLSDVMENIFFGDDFPETQKKFGVDKMASVGAYNYKQQVEKWKQKVGVL